MITYLTSKVETNALSEQGTGSCPCYEKHLLAVLVSHSVAAIRILLSFLQYICRKDFFIMKNYNTKRLCTMAMLIAIAFILGSAAIRIGATIKISFKFLPTFVSAVFFGPLWGGMCGLLSDALAYLINPGSGPYLLQIGLVEFLYGLSYGLFFYKANELNKKNIIKVFICIILNTLILSLGVM